MKRFMGGVYQVKDAESVEDIEAFAAKTNPKIQQGIISHFFDALCFPEWDTRTNLVTYRLYRRLAKST